MSYKLQEIKVGIMVVVSAILLLFFIFIMSGIKFKKDTVIYTTQLKYVGGLEVGTPVRMGGVLIGRISEIQFPHSSSEEIKLVIEISANSPIKSDSRAYLTSIGIMGEFYLEIIPGSVNAERLLPGSEIPSLNATTFSQLAMDMGDLAKSLKTSINGINQLLRPQNQQQVTGILTNLNQIMSNNSSHLTQLMQNLKQMSFELTKISRRVDTIFVNNEMAFKNMMNNLDTTLIESRNLVMKMQKTLSSVDGMVIENGNIYGSIINSLERSTRNLEEFSRGIRARPWSLVRKSNPKPRPISEK